MGATGASSWVSMCSGTNMVSKLSRESYSPTHSNSSMLSTFSRALHPSSKDTLSRRNLSRLRCTKIARPRLSRLILRVLIRSRVSENSVLTSRRRRSLKVFSMVVAMSIGSEMPFSMSPSWGSVLVKMYSLILRDTSINLEAEEAGCKDCFCCFWPPLLLAPMKLASRISVSSVSLSLMGHKTCRAARVDTRDTEHRFSHSASFPRVDRYALRSSLNSRYSA
jgi:hypothetical protein